MKLASWILFALLALSGCKPDGPEGTYRLDPEATKASLKLGFPTNDFEGNFIGTDVTLVLTAGGTYERTLTFPALLLPGRPQQEETEAGKWTARGDELELAAPDHRVSCQVRPDGLDCKSDAFLSYITKGFSSAIHFKKLKKR